MGKRYKGKKQPEAKKTQQPTIINEILVRPIHRGINDIGSWRSALRMADNSSRSKLYDLYTDLLVDGYLSDAIEKRIDAVTDADLAFTIEGKEVEEVTNLMDTPEFEDFLREIMLSRFWGVTVVECYFNQEGFEFNSIPRKHIRPKTEEIVIREDDQKGISYAEDDQIIQFGKDDDFGIILRAAPYVIYKRGGFGDWAQFVEMFGMPQRIGKYSSMDEQSRRALIQAFETAGSAPYLVIPKETEATQTTLSSSGNGALYNDFRNACNEEILITILGQTMTTQDGSSLAQGQVHLVVQEKKHSSDIRFTVRMLNKYFKPLLEKRGYLVTGGKFHSRNKAQELSVTEITQISDLIDIPSAWVHEKFNIPIPVGDEKIAKKQTVLQPPVTVDPTLEEKEIKNTDKSWYRRFMDFFVLAPTTGAQTGKTHIKLNDDTLKDRLIKQVIEGEGQSYFNVELYRFIADQLTSGVQKGLKLPVNLTDFEYGVNTDAFITAMEQNVFHFSAAKTLAELQELNSLFRKSKSFDEFHQEASSTIDTFNAVWQETEYQSALLTAESASNYQRLMQKTSLFPYWEYRTVGDDKVRPEHILLDGVILPANDPRWDKIYPPNGWKCRCSVVPRMRHEVEQVDFDEMRARVDDYFGSGDWKTNAAQGWGVNRAKEAEVFTANQMYIRKFPNQAAKMMDRVSAQDWGIKKSFDTLVKNATQEIIPFEGLTESWWSRNCTTENGKEVLKIKDYNSRTLTMLKRDFDIHTTNSVKSRFFRAEYLNHIHELVSDPDEVWLSRDRKDRNNNRDVLNNILMIKYYKDTVLAAVSKVEKGNLVLKTWYELKDKKTRSGILLKTK